MADFPEKNRPVHLRLRRRNETLTTHTLKRAAWCWLYSEVGCRSVAFEVRLEGPFGRIADVVGLGPDSRVYLVEVKSTRSDASRDNHTDRDRERLMTKQAQLRDSTSLTATLVSEVVSDAQLSDPVGWRDSSEVRLALLEHDRANAQLRQNTERVDTLSTKFHNEAYLRLADYHYIMAPGGVIKPSELPPFWGLLDCTPAVRVEAPLKQVKSITSHVLRSISRANTRDLMVATGMDTEIAQHTDKS